MSHEFPILYSFRRCPYAMGARLALAFAGISYELREISLREKPLEMLELSPKGTVPVLQLSNGRVLEESADIAQWAFTDSNKTPWIGTGKKLFEERSQTFIPVLNRYKYPDRYDLPDGFESRQKGILFLETLETHLHNQSFLCGHELSLADVLIFPFVRQFRVVDRDWFDDHIHLSDLLKWMSFFTQHPLFEKIMERHDPWLKSGGKNSTPTYVFFP